MSFSLKRGVWQGVFAAALWVPVLHAQTPSPTTPVAVLPLQGALNAAYATNPTLASARETARSAQLSAYSRWGGALPTLTAEGYWGGTRYDANGQTDTVHPRGTGVTLTQPLFTGGEIVYAARAASANAKAAMANAEDTAQTTLLATVQAYTGTLAAQARVSATTSLLSSLSRQEDAARARLKAGEGTTTDVALTTARKEEAAGTLALATSTLATQQATLARLTGQPSSTLLVWPEPPAVAGALASPTTHPALAAATARARAAEASQKGIRGALLPDLNATATASQAEDTSLARTSGSQMSYQLKLTVPLFAGFSKFNDNRAALATARAAEDTLTDTRRRVETDQATATTALAAAQANFSAAKAALTAQQTYYDSVDKTYQYGESSLLDVLDAAGDLATAKANLADARANLIYQSYATLAAFGHLTRPTP